MLKDNFATAEQWLEARQPKKEVQTAAEDEDAALEEYMEYQYDCLRDIGIPLDDLLSSFVEFLRKLSPKQMYREDPRDIIRLWEESWEGDNWLYPTFDEFLKMHNEFIFD